MALHTRVAARVAAPKLKVLLGDAEAYPASYDRERLMMEADVILDHALDQAVWLVNKVEVSAAKLAAVRCVVCSDYGCLYCPKA